MRTGLFVFMALAVALPALAEEGEGMRLSPVDNPAAKAECSACHIAYPAGLLPARSWEALMGDLGNHFGEDASLAPDVATGIKDYLVANAGDADGANRMFRGVAKDQTPLRISELPWFKRAHGGEVSPARLKKAGSYANCVACHQDAAKGFFEDD